MLTSRKLKIGLIAATLLGACGLANATDFVLTGAGNTSPGQPLAYLDQVTIHSSPPSVLSGNTRTDDWYFNISQPLHIQYGQVSFQNDSSFWVKLFSPGSSVVPIFSSLTCVGCVVGSTVVIPYALLADGVFRLQIFQTAGSVAGSYTAGFRVVPLPAAAWLLLSGVAGLGAMARRRKIAVEA